MNFMVTEVRGDQHVGVLAGSESCVYDADDFLSCLDIPSGYGDAYSLEPCWLYRETRGCEIHLCLWPCRSMELTEQRGSRLDDEVRRRRGEEARRGTKTRNEDEG